MSYTNDKIGKKEQNIIVMEVRGARGLAKELKDRLNHEFEMQVLLNLDPL
jgi:hypothetical protein